ncbi:MAG: hypothetical protein CMK59_03070 [Proteobacteria bacterium]|nr:hypothetical protein [Pseudomonadota bacterium]
MNAQEISTPQSEFRPSQGKPQARSSQDAFWVALLLAVFVYWLLLPIWPKINTHIIGDAGTDAIRGMWSLDHLRQSLIPPETPLISNRINFPSGALMLALPWTSGVLLSPLGFLFGPIIAWNLSIAILIWGIGMSLAWLVRCLTDSWYSGMLVGGLALSQPMLLHAMGDGTAEHISFWGMPLLLGSLYKTLNDNSTKWGVFSGIIAIMIALDSPYLAVYSLTASVFIVPWYLFRSRILAERIQLYWALGAILAITLIGAVGVGLIYQFFPIKTLLASEKISLLTMNATDLRTWWQHDVQESFIRDSSLPPTTISSTVLLITIILVILGLPKSAPWVLVGSFMFVLSLGLNNRVPVHLGQWLGSYGKELGSMLIELNRSLYSFPALGLIRFPQRWLIPSFLMFLCGAGIGTARLLQFKLIKRFALPISFSIVAIATFASMRSSRLDLNFPYQEVPKVLFTDHLANHPKKGAVLLLPQMRPPPKSGKRSDLPIFANINKNLASSDAQFFQVLHGRAMYTKPSLKTIYSFKKDEKIARLVRNWDDMANPMLTGNEIPPSAYDSRSEGLRQEAIRALIEEGLAFIVLDLGAYNDEAQKLLRTQLGLYIKSEQIFEEGDGILLLELK